MKKRGLSFDEVIAARGGAPGRQRASSFGSSENTDDDVDADGYHAGSRRLLQRIESNISMKHLEQGADIAALEEAHADHNADYYEGGEGEDDLGLIDRKEAIGLLMEARAAHRSDGLLAEFTANEIGGLAECMDFIPFEAGMHLIQMGEDASWTGIILQGEIAVHVGDPATSQAVATLGSGKWLGEMSVFEGGHRTAHCVAASRGVVAAITYDELRELRETEPQLVLKLNHELSVASVVKLRRMVDQANTAARSAKRRQSRRQSRAIKPPAERKRRMSWRSSELEGHHAFQIEGAHQHPAVGGPLGAVSEHGDGGGGGGDGGDGGDSASVSSASSSSSSSAAVGKGKAKAKAKDEGAPPPRQRRRSRRHSEKQIIRDTAAAVMRLVGTGGFNQSLAKKASLQRFQLEAESIIKAVDEMGSSEESSGSDDGDFDIFEGTGYQDDSGDDDEDGAGAADDGVIVVVSKGSDGRTQRVRERLSVGKGSPKAQHRKQSMPPKTLQGPHGRPRHLRKSAPPMPHFAEHEAEEQGVRDRARPRRQSALGGGTGDGGGGGGRAKRLSASGGAPGSPKLSPKSPGGGGGGGGARSRRPSVAFGMNSAAKRRQSVAQLKQTAAMHMDFAQKIVSRSEVLYRQSQAQSAKRHRQHKKRLDDAKRRASVAEQSIKNEGHARKKLTREATVLAAQVAQLEKEKGAIARAHKRMKAELAEAQNETRSLRKRVVLLTEEGWQAADAHKSGRHQALRQKLAKQAEEYEKRLRGLKRRLKEAGDAHADEAAALKRRAHDAETDAARRLFALTSAKSQLEGSKKAVARWRKEAAKQKQAVGTLMSELSESRAALAAATASGSQHDAVHAAAMARVRASLNARARWRRYVWFGVVKCVRRLRFKRRLKATHARLLASQALAAFKKRQEQQARMREALQRERLKNRQRVKALTASHAATVKQLTGQLRSTTARLEETGAALTAARATCAEQVRTIARTPPLCMTGLH